MRFVTSSLLAISLLSCDATPAYALPLPNTQIEQIAQVCAIDLSKWNKGDTTWLERQLSTLPNQEARDKVYDLCKMYARGMIDGMKMRKKGDYHAL